MEGCTAAVTYPDFIAVFAEQTSIITLFILCLLPGMPCPMMDRAYFLFHDIGIKLWFIETQIKEVPVTFSSG